MKNEISTHLCRPSQETILSTFWIWRLIIDKSSKYLSALTVILNSQRKQDPTSKQKDQKKENNAKPLTIIKGQQLKIYPHYIQ